MQTINLSLTLQDAKTLHDALIRLPFGQVEALVIKVRHAIVEAQKPLNPAPASELKKD